MVKENVSGLDTCLMMMLQGHVKQTHLGFCYMRAIKKSLLCLRNFCRVEI